MNLDSFYFKNVKKVVEFAYKFSPFYRKKYKLAGFKPDSLKKLDDIEKIPIVTRYEIVKNFKDVVTKPYYKYLFELENGIKNNSYPKAFLGPEDRIRRYYLFIRTLRKVGYKPYYSTLVYSHQKFERNILNIFNLFKFIRIPPKLSTNSQLNIIEKFKPKQIIYNPLSLFKICKLLEEKNKFIAEKPRLVVTQSEILPGFVKEKIETYLGAVNEVYAASEVGYIGWRINTENFFNINWDSFFIEALSLDNNSHVENENEYGKCIITSLINFSFPIIRYDLEDVIKAIPNNLYTLKIKSVEGKYTDAFIHNGRIITPLFIANKIMPIIKDLFTILLGKNVVLLVEKRNEDVMEAIKILNKFIKNKKVIILKCREIPKTVTGKYNIVIRRLR